MLVPCAHVKINQAVLTQSFIAHPACLMKALIGFLLLLLEFPILGCNRSDPIVVIQLLRTTRISYMWRRTTTFIRLVTAGGYGRIYPKE